MCSLRRQHKQRHNPWSCSSRCERCDLLIDCGLSSSTSLLLTMNWKFKCVGLVVVLAVAAWFALYFSAQGHAVTLVGVGPTIVYNKSGLTQSGAESTLLHNNTLAVLVTTQSPAQATGEAPQPQQQKHTANNTSALVTAQLSPPPQQPTPPQQQPTTPTPQPPSTQVDDVCKTPGRVCLVKCVGPCATLCEPCQPDDGPSTACAPNHYTADDIERQLGQCTTLHLSLPLSRNPRALTHARHNS